MSINVNLSHLWQTPPQRLSLPTDEVHVWRIELEQTSVQIESCLAVLSPDERSRAGKYYFQQDREHFIVARAILRRVLAGYLNRQAHKLRFAYAAYGKPCLEGEPINDVRFNLSHSQGVALLAVTRGRDLGIDLEWIRPEIIQEEIAERFFSPAEVSTLRSLAIEHQPAAFFNCWTRKEAYIKARGEGLSLPLNDFDVSLAPGEPAALLAVRTEPAEVWRWRMVELAPGDGFKAALVVERHDWSLRCWQWLAE